MEINRQRPVLRDTQSVPMPKDADVDDSFDVQMLMLDGCGMI